MEWYQNPYRHCLDLDHIFNPDARFPSAPIVEICTRGGGCPVIWECLQEALDLGDRNFVRGGTGPRTRAAAQRALRKNSPDAEKLVADLKQDILLLIRNNGKRPRKCQETNVPETAPAPAA